MSAKILGTVPREEGWGGKRQRTNPSAACSQTFPRTCCLAEVCSRRPARACSRRRLGAGSPDRRLCSQAGAACIRGAEVYTRAGGIYTRVVGIYTQRSGVCSLICLICTPVGGRAGAGHSAGSGTLGCPTVMFERITSVLGGLCHREPAASHLHPTVIILGATHAHCAPLCVDQLPQALFHQPVS